MKDYVLTTEEIRHIFTWTLDKNADWQDPADFDQWLAEHERQKQAEAWEEATQRAVHILTRRYGASYEAVIDLLGDPNPYEVSK